MTERLHREKHSDDNIYISSQKIFHWDCWEMECWCEPRLGQLCWSGADQILYLEERQLSQSGPSPPLTVLPE